MAQNICLVLPRSSFETPSASQRSPTPIRASGLIIRHCSQTCSGPIRHTTTFAASTQDGFPSVPPHFLLDLTSQRLGGAFEIHITIHPSLPSRVLPSTAGGCCIWRLPIVAPRGASFRLKSSHLDGYMRTSRVYKYVGRTTHGSTSSLIERLHVANAFWERRGKFAGSVLTAGRGFVAILPFGEAVVYSGALRGVSVWMETKVRAHLLTPHQFLHFISPTQNLSVKPTQMALRTRNERD